MAFNWKLCVWGNNGERKWMQLERMILFPEFKPWSVIAVVLGTTGPWKLQLWVLLSTPLYLGRGREMAPSHVRSCTLETQHSKRWYLGHNPGASLAFTVWFDTDQGWDRQDKAVYDRLTDHTFLTEMYLISVTHLEGCEIQNCFGELLCCFLQTKIE